MDEHTLQFIEAWTKRASGRSSVAQLVTEYRRLQAELAACQERERWINIKERLPEDGEGEVLVFSLDDLVGIGVYKGNLRWETRGFFIPNVTHWMPLPAPPDDK